MSARGMEAFDALTVPIEPGVTLVEASAGTGKTFAITRILLRLLLERPEVEKLSQILVVTFTEKATQELVTRIRTTLRIAERVWSDDPPARSRTNEDLFRLREKLGDAKGAVVRNALAALDDLAVSTIHGFCHRVLAESALESGIPFKTTFVEDDSEPFQRAAHDWSRRTLLGKGAGSATLVAEAGESPAAWVGELVRPYRRHLVKHIDIDPADERQALLKDFVLTVDRAFEEEKARRHLLGFDDLLNKLARVLSREGPDGPLATRVRAKFRAALIDEFQDTDRVQYPIFKAAFANCPLFLIGDPKQSIYRFRGADIRSYLRAAGEAERRYTLHRNFRSTAACVEAVEKLFSKVANPFLVAADLIALPPVEAAPPEGPVPAALGGAAMEWWWVDGALGKRGGCVSQDDAIRLLARDIANEVVSLDDAGLPCGRMAVLVRTNGEAWVVKSALDAVGIPAVVSAGADVLRSEESDELVRVASAVAAPHDAWAVRAAMATRLWGSQAAEIARLARGEADREWAWHVERLEQAQEVWRKAGIAAALGRLLAEWRAPERLLALPEGTRRLTNLRQLLELLHDAWATEGLAPETFQAWITRERSVPNTPERRELRLETDADAVQILTIHKSKGLQFDVVFCPSLWHKHGDRAGPLGVKAVIAQDGEESVLDLGSSRNEERQRLRGEEDRAEDLRLAYVALTRAVYRTYIGWGDIGELANDPPPCALGHLLSANTHAERRAALEALVAGSPGLMRLRNVEANAAPMMSRKAQESQAEAQALTLQLGPAQLESWRISSYSALAAGAHADANAEEARDLDDPNIAPDVVRAATSAMGFRGFAKGAVVGTALHEVLQDLDFADAGAPAVADKVRHTLGVHVLLEAGEAGERQVSDVTAMLQTLCSARIPGAGFSLAQVPKVASLREWEFHLPVEGLSTRRIADVLAAHGSDHARGYAPMLRTLKDSALTGYLKGFVDLALEHDGRWWVLDWKSNWLGTEGEDYAPPALGQAMREKHYTLQYHLYLLALHRHLRARQRDYDPARHWGGVAFVFLRGVAGAGENGWFRDAPTPALLDALDAVVGGVA